ncbi:MAG: GNAT family N-acetyltransferase [Anaerolineales bacterium]
MIAVRSVTKGKELGQIRPFDVRKDLMAVSDLVELCFAERLSRDGKALLRKMRKSARNKRFQQWAYHMAGRVSMPFTGFVWEDGGEVIGNLSLIPYHLSAGDFYMIANVAVHPEYQRRGIGRALVRRALDFLRPRNLDGIWLQVDEGNQAAIRLYQGEGFRERTRRTTWFREPEEKVEDRIWQKPASLTVENRYAKHWNQHRKWLDEAYPGQVRWHLPLKLSYLRGGILGFLTRMAYVRPEIRQWSVTVEGEFVGSLTWQSSKRHSDWLWIAAPPGGDQLILEAFFSTFPQPFERRVRLDYPADRANRSLEKYRFSPSRTLIWMKHENDKRG